MYAASNQGDMADGWLSDQNLERRKNECSPNYKCVETERFILLVQTF